mgnify:CR=1 FL=1
MVNYFKIKHRFYHERTQRFMRLSHEALSRAFFHRQPCFVRWVFTFRQLAQNICCMTKGDVCKNLIPLSRRKLPLHKVPVIKVQVFNAPEFFEKMNRLKIIRTLRSAHYSMMSVLRMLNRLDSGEMNIREAINTPGEDEDIVCPADRYISALNMAEKDTLEMMDILVTMKNVNKRTI